MTTDAEKIDAKELMLRPLLESAGAEFMTVCGWSVPAHFGEPEAEYHAARDTAVLFDASFLTVVRATGTDHVEYLNRRLSQRVIESQPGTVFRACQLNGEGRMEADLELLRTAENESLMVAPPGVAGDYLAALMDKFVFTEDAKFTDETADWCAFAVIGPRAAEALKAVGIDADVPERGHWSSVDLAGASAMLFRSSWVTNEALLLVPAAGAEKVARMLAGAVEQMGGRRLGFLAFDTLRVEAGVPWWGIDVDTRSIPLDADLMEAIHTNKGCYPGQETIAKILNLGHPARKLVGVVFEGEDPPAPGSSLKVDGKDAGSITSSTWSPRLGKAIGLAMVRWPYRAPGRTVVTQDGTKGCIAALPLEAT